MRAGGRLGAESALLRPPPRHAEAPDVAVGGQRAVRVQDDDRERDDPARHDAHEPHVFGYDVGAVDWAGGGRTILAE